jgi:hypothetical protein
MVGNAQVRQVLFGIEVTLFALVLAVTAPSASGIALAVAFGGVLLSLVEPRRAPDSGPAPAALADERHEHDGTV